MALFAENMEHIDMIRTPLKTRNQEFTPGLGKRPANKTMFATPTKRMTTATPRSVLGKQTVCGTPANLIFKKPRMSPSMKIPVKTPGKFSIFKQVSTPNKFSIYEDNEDDILKEMKRKNFKIEQPEKCPWADMNNRNPVKSEPLPPLELVDDFVHLEPARKKHKAIIIDPLPADDLQFTLDFDLSVLPPLPELPELNPESDEPELCPWTFPQYHDSKLDETAGSIDLNESALSDIDATKEKLSQISIRCFNESFARIERCLSEDELPALPSTPDLDLQLAELLELSFETFTFDDEF